MHARLGSLLGTALVVALPACRPRSHTTPSVEVAARWPAPSDDVGESCADLSDVRVCWDGAASAHVGARPVPPFAPPTPLGFRCIGRGAARACESRDLAGEPFVCAAAGCTQRHPRQPDDGEWTCADDAGVAVCVGGERAAGVAAVDIAPEWICGARRAPGARDGLGTRVCVDLSPDFPDGSASGFRCHWSYDHGTSRACTRDPEAHVVGEACNASHPCIDGATCVAARCVPPKPTPSCWLDVDCGNGACRFGSCSGA